MNSKTYSDMHGFRVVRSTEIEEISSTLVEMEHIKSGARLAFNDREDDNKTFAIGFRTIPTDDTGVFHIIEHCVLSGSEKFPVKDPFTQVLKTSIYTQLNAYTYPDRTIYPVSSKNNKSFLGLIDVYMDAVLHPLLLRDKSIFLAEGCRIEKTDDGVQIGGVVYNEMLGAYSSPDEIAERNLMQTLFSGGTYAHDSGGHPDAIPTLRYEDICRVHGEFYHPSNSCIFLDGSVELEKILALLDSYLCEYDRRCNEKSLVRGTLVTDPVVTSYPSEGELDRSDKLVIAYPLCTSKDVDTQIMAEITLDAIADGNSSPLISPLLESELCDSFFSDVACYLQDCFVSFNFSGVKRGKSEELIKLFDSTINKILKDGIPTDRLSAVYNNYCLHAKESVLSASRGSNHMTTAIASMLYGEPPSQMLAYNQHLLRLKENIDKGNVEKTFLSLLGSKRATVLLEATDEPSDIGKKGLEAAEKYLSQMQVDEYRDHLTELEACNMRMATEDSEEAIASLPRLSREDINRPSPYPVPQVRDLFGSKLLVYNVNTNGIAYIRLFFDASDLSEREIKILRLMTAVYSEMDTEYRDTNSFHTDIQANGDINLSIIPLPQEKEARLFLSFKAMSLTENVDKISDLLIEYALKVKLDSIEKVRFEIEQKYTGMLEALFSGSPFMCKTRALSRYSTLSAAREHLFGYEYFLFIKELRTYGDEEMQALIAEMRRLGEKIMKRERATITLAGCVDERSAEKIITAFPSGDAACRTLDVPTLPEINEGFPIHSGPSHTAVAAHISRAGLDRIPGHMSVLKKIVGYEYLWDEIRAKGGAYGASLDLNAGSCSTVFSSFRDPSPARTLEIFKNTPLRLRELLSDERDLTPYIISTAGNLDTVETPASMTDDATLYLLTGRSAEELQLIHDEIIATDIKDVIELSFKLEKMLYTATVCVAAPRDELSKMKLDAILESELSIEVQHF